MEVKRRSTGMQTVHAAGTMVRKGKDGIRRAEQSARGSLTSLSIRDEDPDGQENGKRQDPGGVPGTGRKGILHKRAGAGTDNRERVGYRPGLKNLPGSGRAKGTGTAASGKHVAAQAGNGAARAADSTLKAGKAAAAKGASAATATAGGVATGGTATAAAAAAYAAKKAKDLLIRMKEAAVSAAEGKRHRDTGKEGDTKGAGKTSSTAVGAAFILAVSLVLMNLLTALVLFLLVLVMPDPGAGAAGKILAVARQEEAAAEADIGGTKYKTWYGIHGNWCAMFVSWCADQCGYIESGIMPKTASVQAMLSWYQAKEQYHAKEDGYVPQAGDVVFFTNGRSHVGLVVSYDPATKILVTIEGNAGASQTEPYHEGSRVMERRYPLTYDAITGYGTPRYPVDENADEGEETGITDDRGTDGEEGERQL